MPGVVLELRNQASKNVQFPAFLVRIEQGRVKQCYCRINASGPDAINAFGKDFFVSPGHGAIDAITMANVGDGL